MGRMYSLIAPVTDRGLAHPTALGCGDNASLRSGSRLPPNAWTFSRAAATALTARAQAHKARLTPPRCPSARYDGALSCAVILDASACRPPLDHERHHQTRAEGDVDRGDVRGVQMVFEAWRETFR